MVLLSLFQEDTEMPMAFFDTMEEGRAFLSLLPGYRYQEDMYEGIRMTSESLDPKAFPDYLEIEYKGNVFPVSRFMFDSDNEVDIIWREIPYLSAAGDGLVIGTTKVDAYVLSNDEVKEYIQSREWGFQVVSKILKQKGFFTGRAFRGSEDGEAIVYGREEEAVDHILNYMDPEFVDIARKGEEALEQWVLEHLQEEL